MSAYYLRQVVKEWSLATIYKGMFEFMILQVIAIVLIIAFPKIALWFPLEMQELRRGEVVERVEDDAGSLEQDTMESMQQQSQDALEEPDGAAPPAGDKPDEGKK
jgi:hypothetical protein